MKLGSSSSAWALVLLLLLGNLVSGPGSAVAQSRLGEFLAKVPPAELFPGADKYNAPQGAPPVATVRAGERVLGYAFVNADWVDSTGYSGRPIQILIGLATDGRIAGARLMDHHEPIVLIGIPPARIAKFIAGYVGRDVLALAKAGPEGHPLVDIVSGATVTVTVIGESIVHSAIRVARAKGMSGAAVAVENASRGEIDPAHAAPPDWIGLIGDGSVRRLRLSVGDVTEAFARAGDAEAAQHPESDTPSDFFIDLYVAPVSVPAIGKRLLGDARYANLAQTLAPGQQAILIAANGAYSFKGSGYVRGGIFDRIALGSPRALLLDEPTSGLDPALRQGFHEVLRELRRAGASVLLSSHALAELEGAVDRVVVMTRGRKMADGDLSRLRHLAGIAPSLCIRLAAPAILRGWHAAAAGTLECACAEAEIAARLRTLPDGVVSVEILRPSLDDVSVVAPTATEVNALSTTFTLMSREQARAVITARGLAARFVLPDGRRVAEPA
jgi:hypothetical protein